MKKHSLFRRIVLANVFVFASVFLIFTCFTIMKAYRDNYKIAEDEAGINLRKSVASCLYHFKKSDFIELQRFVSSFTATDSLKEVLMLFSSEGQIITTNNFEYFNNNREKIKNLLDGKPHNVRLEGYVFAVKAVEADSAVYGYAVYATKIEMRKAVVEQELVLFVLMVITLILIILIELFLVNKFTEPLKSLILSFRNNDLKQIKTDESDIQELAELKDSYNFWVSETDRYQRSLKEKTQWEAYSKIASQVAHDIRSPLAALEAAAKGLDIHKDQRTLVNGAVGRIQAIADDLLTRYRAHGAEVKAKMECCPLAGLIEQVVAEKRIQHKDKAGVSLEFSGAGGLKAAVNQREFQRLISNLLNNAVEALDKGGTVAVGISASGGQVLIEVRDNGKGIQPEILAKLGEKGETHGKAGGTGLGLYHARTTVEGWGGSFRIGSEPGKGTTVAIELPEAVNRQAVLLDDDMLVHMNWKLAAKAAGVELKAYKTREDFSAGTVDLSKDVPVYIDSDLGKDIKGEEIAKGLHDQGFTNITMATGHDALKFAHLPWLKVAGKEPPWA